MRHHELAHPGRAPDRAGQRGGGHRRDSFRFTHLLFQEYLAAERLAALGFDKALGILDAHVANDGSRVLVANAVALFELRHGSGSQLLDALVARAVDLTETGHKATAFASLLGAALDTGIWNDHLADLLQTARALIENASDDTAALDAVVAEAMRVHGEVSE